MIKPLSGIDHYIRRTSPKEKKRSLGLVTNNAATTVEDVPTVVALLQAGFNLQLLFSPEHGFEAKGADGESQPDGIESLTGLKIVSLYGKHYKPGPAQLAKLDALLFDIPDIGCRFYTYLWTMTYCMEACAAAGLPFIVLDRPNPLGGNLELAEGPWLDEANCASFIGRWNIPIRHSCTLGELARYFAATRLPNLDLHIIPCTGWNRQSSFFQHPEWFKPTSPAMQHISSAMFFPGTGFWEAVNIHEGRGTALPFMQMGAPWIDSTLLLDNLKNAECHGIEFSAVRFTPVTGRYKGDECYGIRCSIEQEDRFRPVQSGIRFLQILKQLFPDKLQEAPYPTAANPTGAKHLDKLTGVVNSFERLQHFNWPGALNIQKEWLEKMNPFLLY